MRHVLYINDVPSSDYGVYISSDTYLNAPQIDYTAYQVPARNGDLVQFNKRFNNVVRHFVCFIPKNVNANLDGFKKLLYSNMGYLKIASDYDPEVYQYGFLAEGLTAEPFRTGGALQATFELFFSCQPHKLFSGSVLVSRTYNAQPITLIDAGSELVRFVQNHSLIEFEPTNIGWAYASGGSSTYIDAGSGTVQLRGESTTADTYAMVAVDVLDETDSSKWQFIGSTSNGEIDFTIQKKNYAQKVIAVTTVQPKAMGVNFYNVDAGVQVYFVLVSWTPDTRSNSNAIGSSPVIALKMQRATGQVFGINYLNIDDTFITFDMESLVADLGEAFFLANYTTDDCFLLVTDTESGNVWITKSSDLADYETADLSINNYVQIIEGGEHGDTIRLASAYSGSGNVVRPVEVGGNAGWWKL